MPPSVRQRPLQQLCAAFALLAASGAPALAAPQPHWVPAGQPGEMMQYFIDAGTVRNQRELTYYRVMGRGVQAASRDTSVEAEVGVDCQRRTRVEYMTTVRWRDGVRTATAADLKPVQEGSRQAQELAVACQLAQAPVVGDRLLASGGRPLETELGAGALPAAAAQPPAAPRWSGSGFAVARNMVVTNNHVVRGCTRVQVAHGDASYEARVVATDRRSDLAALEVAEGGLLPLELADGPRELGEAVTVLGYPLANVLGSDLRVATGIVSGLSGVGGDPKVLQISAPVQPGNSGGPVLDDQGRVAAVVVTRMDLRMNTENVSFAVRAPVLREFLGAHAIGYRTGKTARKAALTVAQSVKRAAPSVLLVSCA